MVNSGEQTNTADKPGESPDTVAEPKWMLVNAGLVLAIRAACKRLDDYVADQFDGQARDTPKAGYYRYDEKMADLREAIADLAGGI